MRFHSILLPVGCLLSSFGFAEDARQTADAHVNRWSEEKANQWYAKQPWLVGFNYVPSTACNNIEMWQERASLFVYHDEECEIYLNGVLALNASGYLTSYRRYEILPDAGAAFRQGENMIAIYCRWTIGGQFIDVGLAVGGPRVEP